MKVDNLYKIAVITSSFIILGGFLTANPLEESQETQKDVIIGFENEHRPDIVRKHGGTVTGGESVDLFPVTFANVPKEAIKGLENNPHVEFVEEDAKAETMDQTEPYGPKTQTNALDVSETVDASNVNVAVLDTGVDYDHPDLDGNIEWCVDAEGRGVTRGDCKAADDKEGHGTHVAGTVAAEDNNQGVIGASSSSNLYAIKVLGNSGSGSYSDIIEGIDEAAKGPDGELGTDDDAHVISMSLGGSSGSEGMRTAVNEAYSDGSVVVAAAGNNGDGDPTTNEVSYPAKYSNAIAVAATDRDENTPEWSSEGEEVEISAHGVSVYSTYKNGGYEFLSGTSMATPLVSGNIALMIASDLEDGKTRDYSNDELRQRMRDTAFDIEKEGFDNYSGYGVINASAAVWRNTGEKPSINITNPVSGKEVSGLVELRANASDSDASVDSVEFYIDGTSVGIDTDGSDGWNVSWNSSTVGDGTHTMTAVATDTQGLTNSDSVDFSTENFDSEPSVSWSNPGDGDKISGTEEIRISASDDNSVSSVEWQVDGGTLYTASDTDGDGVYNDSLDTTTFSEGTHNLTAIATDSAGQTSSEKITIEVDNNEPPAISWNNPVESDTVEGTVTLEVEASDSDGTVETVEWSLDGETPESMSDSDGDGLYEATWDTSQVSDGTHTLAASATDDDGETGTSEISVTVDNQVNEAPVIDSYSATEAGSPNPHLEVTADWKVSDTNSNLDYVTMNIINPDTGSTEASSTTQVSGSSDTGSDQLTVKQADDQTFDVVLTVADTEGKTSSKTQSVTE